MFLSLLISKGICWLHYHNLLQVLVPYFNLIHIKIGKRVLFFVAILYQFCSRIFDNLNFFSTSFPLFSSPDHLWSCVRLSVSPSVCKFSTSPELMGQFQLNKTLILKISQNPFVWEKKKPVLVLLKLWSQLAGLSHYVGLEF